MNRSHGNSGRFTIKARHRLLKEDKSQWLFPGRDPNHTLDASLLRAVFAKIKVHAGIQKEFTVHGLRHCFATHLLEMGVQLRFIQVMLGHASISSTTFYTRVESKQFREIKSPLDEIVSQLHKI